MSCHAAPFLSCADEEPADIFFRLALSCLCAVLISSDRIFFQTPFFCGSWNLLCADDLTVPCRQANPPAACNQHRHDCVYCGSVVTSWPSSCCRFWQMWRNCIPLRACHFLKFHEDALYLVMNGSG